MNWDWSAAYYGLGPSEGVFVPFYWRLVAHLTSPFGFLPDSLVVLTFLVGTMAFLWSMLFWSKRRGPHWLAFALSGALTADTPYVLVLPALVCAVAMIARRIGLERQTKVCKVSLPWANIGYSFAIPFIVVVCANFLHCGGSYVAGYVGNARTVLRDSGLRHPFVAREMDGLLKRYAEEILREKKDRRWLFTDGVCDAVVVTLARQKDVPLRTIPLIGTGADGSCRAWAGLSSPEDQAALRTGSGSLLRTWTVDRPDNLERVAFQSGFAFMERTSPRLLSSAGLVMLTGETTETERERSMKALRALGDEIVRFFGREDPARGGRIRQMRFYAMQWCVSGALRRLAETTASIEKKGVVDGLVKLAEELDRLNPVLDRLQAGTRLTTRAAAASLTVREGLALALKHADFVLARDFAQQILKENADHAEANFALGMDCLLTQKFAQARYFLDKAHAAKPKEPAILNNLALASLGLGDLETAERQAQEALALAPNEKEIKDTLARILAEKSKKRD